MGLTWPDALVVLGIVGTVLVAVIKGVPKRANGAERANAERLARIEADITYLRLDMDRIMAHLGMFHPVRPMNPTRGKPAEEYDS